MRVVVDTNVWVSALLSRDGLPALIAEASGIAFTPIFCPSTLQELLLTAEHKTLAKRGLTPGRLGVLTMRLVAVSEQFATDPPIQFATRDPKDDIFVALCAAAQADFLVTGDRDFLSDSAIRDYLAASGVRLATVRQFVEALEAD